MKPIKKIIGLFILLGALLFCISIDAAEKKRLDAKDYITEASEDQTSEINNFLITCKNKNADAFFSKGVYKIDGTIVLANGVSLYGEEGTIFRGMGTTYQSYIRDTKEKVTNITIEHIIFDNMTMYFQNGNSTNITIEHNIFANAKRVDLSISTGLNPDRNNQNGGESTGYYIAKNHKTITIKSNLFFRDENSLGRCLSIYYTENALIQDNYFGLVEDIDKSIVSPETKALKEEAIASGILSETSNQGYFMSAINVINSDRNAKIIGNHFSINTDITEERYEDKSQATYGYNRDHIIYAKMFNGLEVVGNYFKGMNKNQDGGIKFRNGENLLIHKNVLEDTMILMYVQNANTNLWFRNIYIKENIFINRFYTTDSYTSSITNNKKNFSAEFLFLLMNYDQTADVTNITMESNKMISPKFANEEIRIDNRNFAMPTNVTVRNNINGIVNQPMRIRIVNTNGISNWYDSNTSSPNFSNVTAGAEAFTMDTSSYEDISVDALVNLDEVEYSIEDRKLVTDANLIFVDGVSYTPEEKLEYGEHYIFLTTPTTVPLVVEGNVRTLQTNLFTALKIVIERQFRLTYNTNQHGETIEEEYTPRLPETLPILSEDGYRFDGWFLDESFTQKAVAGEGIDQDTILYAKWTKLYNVTYNVLGHGKAPEDLFNISLLPEILPVLSEEGYRFDGWYLDENFKTGAIENAVLLEDITLYAKWTKIPVYTISFDSQGGSSVDSISLLEGNKPSMVKEPTKAGYLFMGWYTDKACTVLWDIDAAVENDLTLYAKWNPIPKEFKVTFQAIDGEVYSEIVVKEGTSIQKPEEPKRNGYDFDGWYTTKDYTTRFDFENKQITEDTILYGKWIVVVVKYTITYQINGHGKEPAKVGEVVQLPNPLLVLTADGYEFGGWYLDKDFKTPATAGAEITANTTLYAKWTKLKIRYTVTFYVKDEGVFHTDSILEASKIARPEDPQKEGYEFYGWYEDETYTTQWNFEQDAVVNNITLYGMFVNESGSTEDNSNILLYILLPVLCVFVGCGAVGIVIFKKRKK
ncbi:MAG: InlB B-repeat-containing protein [Anaeroplasmataceae bacterium]|nr:InlB B-repeat-containing protein [Anaeroplasmataceae bacterium]MDE6242211.1 InlB B-repeat-containing protein [Anaeroplasmataceae bacterium]